MFVDLRCLVGGVTGKGEVIGEVVAFFARRMLSAADLVAQTEQHGQRPVAATTSTARGHELAGADSHMACAPTRMGGDPQVVDGIPPELAQNTSCGRERERRIS